MPESSVITITSGVSEKSKWPFVHLSWGENAGQLTVQEAREHALRILEVCTAAEHDSAIVKLLGVDEKQQAELMRFMRQSRGAEMGSGRTQVYPCDDISVRFAEPEKATVSAGLMARMAILANEFLSVLETVQQEPLYQDMS